MWTPQVNTLLYHDGEMEVEKRASPNSKDGDKRFLTYFYSTQVLFQDFPCCTLQLLAILLPLPPAAHPKALLTLILISLGSWWKESNTIKRMHKKYVFFFFFFSLRVEPLEVLHLTSEKLKEELHCWEDLWGGWFPDSL